ncbi:MAG: dihydroneopterin aldolase [Candidatus Omnitrophica bacterium]|nr:dihydroneopterin aldolase [Candidatus Omnitrophota bacterium]
MATVRIADLSLRAIIGINKWEREKKQDVIINIAFDFDAQKAIQSDDINDTVDYKDMKQKIVAFVEKSNFNLVEKLADEVLNIVMADPKVENAHIKIDKPSALRFAKSVSIELSRTK